MHTVVIEHVALNELPEQWRARFPIDTRSRVTVRIEEEEPSIAIPGQANPLFGIWKDRDDMADVDEYMEKLRSS